MSVRFSFGRAPPSYKPPGPDKEPDEKLFPLKLTGWDGNPYWVSIPQPDALTLVGDVTYDHFPPGEVDHTNIEGLAPKLMKGLATKGALPWVEVGKTGYWKDQGVYTKVNWTLPGHPGSAVNFSTAKSKSATAAHTLRVEFNPRRLGSGGVEDLLDAIHCASGKRFRVGKWLADARVTRLDVAVDVIGLGVSELIVSAANEGQRVHYYGADGDLETVYLHRARKPLKPDEIKQPWERKLGSLILRVYDRRRQMLKAGEVPASEPAWLTRIEVAKTAFGNKPFGLPSLPPMKHPFGKARVGQWASDAPTAGRIWLRYVNLRRAGSHDWASSLMALKPKEAEMFEAAFRDHPSDVLVPAKVWQHWSEGLKATGCEELIQAAELGAAGSFMGDLNGYGPEGDH